MKFFRQTKETKRKISFFLALAMVISLLPVSPVAKAAEEEKFTVYCDVENAVVESVESTTSGSAIITLTGKNSTAISSASIEVGIATGSSVGTNNSVNVNVTGSSAATSMASITVGNPVVENGKCKITVSGVTNKDALLLTGSVALADPAATTAPTDEPTTAPTDEPTTTPTDEPTTAPVVKYTVTVKNSVGENIVVNVNKEAVTGETSLEIENGQKLPVEITPAEDYIWNSAPEVTVGSEEVDLTLSGVKYATEVTINKDTAIVVSGGSVISVSNVTNAMESAKPAEGNTEGASIDMDSVKNSIVQAIIDANPSMTAGAIIGELESNSSSIKTSYKISETTSAAAITTIKDSFNSLKETLGNDVTSDKFNKAIEEGYTVDIDINVTYTLNNTSYTTTVSVLGDEVTVTIPVPDALKDKDTTKGSYYAFRIHGEEVTAIPCELANGVLTFKSDKFSTYVISFVEKDDTPANPTTAPTTTPGGSTSVGGGIGGYIPSTSATPAPSATAAPSESPSADPSAAPGTDNTAAPSESDAPATGGDATPTDAPAATDKPADSDDGNTNGGTSTTTVKVGKKATVSGSQYKVTAVKGTRTVQFTKGKTNAKSIVVPSTVKISGKNYKVTTIAKNAFKGNKKLTKVTIGKNVNKIGATAFKNCTKLKSVVIKTTKLTAKKVGKNAFKGIKKNATFKVPSSKVKAYTKIVKAKGAGKNVKVKK